ncbi:hypothetical protein E8E12_002718 [Didymella heteroderae]|uniref:Peptidase M12A domain-containing protein n=1 Tax=Didymella heteroderae TaxID=1769908 RepID=A0A9P4WQN4_9PLEO|nr:hypothetical protein E8E12_002718 [Didymella heteroderae]
MPGLQHWLAAPDICHVLGFMHEHQRAGRDHFVHFECKNLTRQALQQPIYFPMDPWKSLGFAPHDYSTEEFYDKWHEDKDGHLDGTNHRYTVTTGLNYDLYSIMHYLSVMISAKGGDQRMMQDMPPVV